MRNLIISAALAYLAMFLAGIVFHVISMQSRKKWCMAVSGTAVAVSLSFVNLSFVSARILFESHELNRPLSILTGYWVMPAVLVTLAGTYVLLSVVLRRSGDGSTEHSVYLGINKLSTGLCCYLDDGRTLMVNEKMDEISFKATGSYLYNGLEFRNWLKKNVGTANEIEIGGVHYLYSFRNLSLQGKTVHEIILADVGEEYALNEKLNKETARRYEYQKQLKQYSKNIDELIRNEEILNAKIKSHAEFGNLLLLGKYSLTHKEERADFIRKAGNLSSLIAARQSEDNQLKELSEIAGSIGIFIHIDGTIRKEHEEAVIRLLHESVTNCRKHTKGENLFLDIFDDGKTVRYVCHNDGQDPKAPIVEGGGLSSVRKITEKLGGTISYLYEDKFRITLTFRGGNKDEN